MISRSISITVWALAALALPSTVAGQTTSVEERPAASKVLVTSEWEEASREAKRRGAAILAYSNGSCRRCLEPVQELLAHPSFQRAAAGVVIWMRPARASNDQPRLPRRTDPLVHIVDAWGAQRVQLQMVPGTVKGGRFDPSPLVNYATATLAAGPAFHAAGEAFEKNQDSAVGEYNLGTGYLLLGDLDQAREKFERSRRLALQQGDALLAETALVDLELVRGAQGERAGAIERLSAIAGELTHASARAHAHAVRGSLLIAEGRRNEGREAYDAALASVPANSPKWSSVQNARRDALGDDDRLPVLQLQLPARRPLEGKVNVRAVPGTPVVAAVEFRLEGRLVVRDDSPPFETNLTIVPGSSALLEATAYGADASVLGRTSYPINRSWEDFRVTITEPAAGRAGGLVTVTAEIAPPAGESVASASLFWNEEQRDTATRPPWRMRGTVPSDEPGFLRVVATSSSGRQAESAIPVNLEGGFSTLDVNRTEIPIRVRSESASVDDLTAAGVRLTVAGSPREIESLEFQGGGGVTLGLIIDASTSMRPHMMDVHSAARELLQAAHSIEGSRSFIVAFSDRAQLVHPLSTDLESLSRAVDEVNAGGRTALWDAVVLSLLQMNAVKGRRGLVVLSDGVATPSLYKEADAVRIAKETGIPVFTVSIIEPADLTQRTSRGWQIISPRERASPLIRAALASGGDSEFVRSTEELDEIFMNILESIRNQYVLSFRPDAEGQRRWSPIDIDVERRGVRVHAPDGVWEGTEAD